MTVTDESEMYEPTAFTTITTPQSSPGKIPPHAKRDLDVQITRMKSFDDGQGSEMGDGVTPWSDPKPVVRPVRTSVGVAF